MSILGVLRSQRTLFVQCPACSSEFPVRDAQLFDATKQLPPQALKRLQEMRTELLQARANLLSRKMRATERAQVTAESVNVGKVVEKIAPSLPGFPLVAADCRSLFEPIDYLVFRGLSIHGQVSALYFVDVKSGQARLTGRQRKLRELVETGRLSMIVADTNARSSA
jgi:predicted Holliday junction resolvase-like endonuclease